MGNKALTFLTKAKAHLDTKLEERRKQKEPIWPPHSLFCNCNKCLNKELRFIKTIRVKDVRVEAKQKAKAAKRRKATA